MEKSGYSKSTLRGIAVFTVLCVIIFILPDLIVYFSPKPEIQISQWDEVEKGAVQKVNKDFAFSYRNNKKKKFNVPPEKFDPNTYKLEDWMRLGLSDKQSAAVIKFLQYPIYSNAELKRIFVIPDQLFQLIKDSTVYPKRLANDDLRTEYQMQKKLIAIDINSVQYEGILEVDEISAYDAKSLIKYRDALGGFVSKSQYSEVWKATPEKVLVWEKYLVINPNAISQLNINKASARELSFHPYIDWSLANSLIKIREQHGPFKQVEEIKKSVLMTKELYDKLAPYLKTEE